MIDLVQAWFSGDDSDQIHVLRQVTNIRREVKAYHVDAGGRCLFLGLNVTIGVKPIYRETENEAKGSICSSVKVFSIGSEKILRQDRAMPYILHELRQHGGRGLDEETLDVWTRQKPSQPLFKVLVEIYTYGLDVLSSANGTGLEEIGTTGRTIVEFLEGASGWSRLWIVQCEAERTTYVTTKNGF